MSRSLTFEAGFDVPPLDAFRTRNRLDYLEAKAEALGQEEFSVLELRHRDGRFRCAQRWTIETELPGWARRLLRPRNVVTQYELWHDPWADGSRVYDIATFVANVPVTIRGRGSVTPDGRFACRYHLDLEVSSTAPAVGKRVENLVAGQLDRIAAGELEFGSRWLAQRV